MTLLDRYLHAVRFFLPRHQQDDIVRELSENIGENEDRAPSELGRDLSEPEIADILRRHGHPMVVAARFGAAAPSDRAGHLSVLRFALKARPRRVVRGRRWCSRSSVRRCAATSVASLIDGLLAYPDRALIVFAWTTIGFAAVDVGGSGRGSRRTGIRGSIPGVDGWPTPGHARPVHASSRCSSACWRLGWFLLVPTSPWLALGPLAAVLAFAPVWRLWYVPLVLMTAATLALDGVD